MQSNTPIFFDTEFDPGSKSAKLISAGFVSADGLQSYYREFTEDREFKSSFVNDHIVPSLVGGDAVVNEKAFIAGLMEFLISCGENPELICDSMEDQILLTALFKRNGKAESLPAIRVFAPDGFDQEEIYDDAYSAVFDPITNPRHHALNDAYAIRSGYLAVTGAS